MKNIKYYTYYVFILIPLLLGASSETDNFIIDAPTIEIAQKVGNQSEIYRKEISKNWFQNELPTWKTKCCVFVKITDNNAGASSCIINNNKLIGSYIEVHGNINDILLSVLPHEITHVVFVSYLGQIPRWADEGMAMLSEDKKEIDRYDDELSKLIDNELTLEYIFNIKSYPENQKDLKDFYNQSYSICKFLIEYGGKQKFIKFIQDSSKDYNRSLEVFYGINGYEELEKLWRVWFINNYKGKPLVVKAIEQKN